MKEERMEGEQMKVSPESRLPRCCTRKGTR